MLGKGGAEPAEAPEVRSQQPKGTTALRHSHTPLTTTQLLTHFFMRFILS